MDSTATAATRDVVMQYFSALMERDLEKVTKVFSEQVDWYVPGNEVIAPWLGKRNTRAEIEDFFKVLWKNTEPVSGTIDHLLVSEHVALTSGSFASRMLQTGKVLESLFFTEITVTDGLITKYRLLEDSFALVKALEPADSF